tara:strand:+ start:4854 stop:5921 length:1068 start_codon:yes stop_codon:yes gene_type:complete
MTTLILPVAGKSSRFKGLRPKWLLTMPDGKLLIEKSIRDISLDKVNKIVIICLKEHLDQYISKDDLIKLFSDLKLSVEIVVLNKQTSSVAETVAKGIMKANISGPIFIKDCDNIFTLKYKGNNSVAVIDLNNIDFIDAKNKSYVEVDKLYHIKNIVEKNVISNLFCCGGYGFEDSSKFIKYFKKIFKANTEGEIYISHVIYSMLIDGEVFKAEKAKNYEDFGTSNEYFSYMNTFLTVFCDIDGVLLENGSKFGKKKWKTQPLENNIKLLAEYQRKSKLYLIITTSRPQSEKSYISKILARYNLIPDQYVMGLPHSKRYLINDFTQSNPYPSAISINITRDSDNLVNLLKPILRDF